MQKSTYNNWNGLSAQVIDADVCDLSFLAAMYVSLSHDDPLYPWSDGLAWTGVELFSLIMLKANQLWNIDQDLHWRTAVGGLREVDVVRHLLDTIRKQLLLVLAYEPNTQIRVVVCQTPWQDWVSDQSKSVRLRKFDHAKFIINSDANHLQNTEFIIN